MYLKHILIYQITELWNIVIFWEFSQKNKMVSGKRSCQDHINSLTTIIRNRLTENKRTYCAFIDMEKACDWVNRKLLLYKLLNYNIDDKMYKSIKTLLTNTLSCIELNGSLRSEWFENVCGVRQGDCLSPTLFSLYINDLAIHLKRVRAYTRPQWCAHKFFTICRWPCDNGINRGTAAKFTESGFQLVFYMATKSEYR